MYYLGFCFSCVALPGVDASVDATRMSWKATLVPWLGPSPAVVLAIPVSGVIPLLGVLSQQVVQLTRGFEVGVI